MSPKNLKFVTELVNYCKLPFFNSLNYLFSIYIVYFNRTHLIFNLWENDTFLNMPTLSFGFLEFNFLQFGPILMTRKIFGKKSFLFGKDNALRKKNFRAIRIFANFKRTKTINISGRQF